MTQSQEQSQQDALWEPIINGVYQVIDSFKTQIATNLYLAVRPPAPAAPPNQEQPTHAFAVAYDTQRLLLCLTALGAAAIRGDGPMLLEIIEEWKQKMEGVNDAHH